jgi:hypothetical protein
MDDQNSNQIATHKMPYHHLIFLFISKAIGAKNITSLILPERERELPDSKCNSALHSIKEPPEVMFIYQGNEQHSQIIPGGYLGYAGNSLAK